MLFRQICKFVSITEEEHEITQDPLEAKKSASLVQVFMHYPLF